MHLHHLGLSLHQDQQQVLLLLHHLTVLSLLGLVPRGFLSSRRKFRKLLWKPLRSLFISLIGTRWLIFVLLMPSSWKLRKWLQSSVHWRNVENGHIIRSPPMMTLLKSSCPGLGITIVPKSFSPEFTLFLV